MIGFKQLLKYPNQKMTLKKVSGGRRLLLNEPEHKQTNKHKASGETAALLSCFTGDMMSPALRHSHRCKSVCDAGFNK